eukprot:Blabericola_migrator_1__2750@NODE_1785_length_3794_cov_53_322780_g1150_i0_p3_GENE_NODE_1785_length_3794_cov_53_322780_g1150_i0NODE_1785_length_3794_cov_53_322780_g1150_i0_p3_ORF_typecomplete_len105_score10_10_NODE_1785_length_3794_cov_53_322780_g1150_i0197511
MQQLQREERAVECEIAASLPTASKMILVVDRIVKEVETNLLKEISHISSIDEGRVSCTPKAQFPPAVAADTWQFERMSRVFDGKERAQISLITIFRLLPPSLGP